MIRLLLCVLGSHRWESQAWSLRGRTVIRQCTSCGRQRVRV